MTSSSMSLDSSVSKIDRSVELTACLNFRSLLLKDMEICMEVCFPQASPRQGLSTNARRLQLSRAPQELCKSISIVL